MLQKTFGIYSDDLDDVQLFAEAGKNHIACWCKKNGDNKLSAFEFFLCNDDVTGKTEAVLHHAKLQSKLLEINADIIYFSWNTDEVLCLPDQYENEDFIQANFDLMFPKVMNAKIFSAGTDHCLVSWRIQTEVQQAVKNSLGNVIFNHPYTSLLSASKPADAQMAYLFFYPHYFTLILFKENKLQLIQTRKYTSPEDVLYFILNVFRQYNIEKNTAVLCGGFIEEQSKLFETLYQYIEGFEMIKPDKALMTTAFEKYAPHYFLPYINYLV